MEPTPPNSETPPEASPGSRWDRTADIEASWRRQGDNWLTGCGTWTSYVNQTRGASSAGPTNEAVPSRRTGIMGKAWRALRSLVLSGRRRQGPAPDR